MEALSATQGPGEYASFCRICTAGCGTRLTVDDQGHITRVVGDDRTSCPLAMLASRGFSPVMRTGIRNAFCIR